MYVNASWKTHIQIIYKFLNLPPIIIWKNQAKCGKIYLCDYKKNRRKYMNKLILFHGSPNKEKNPTYGLCNDKNTVTYHGLHDLDLELAVKKVGE